MPRFQYDYDLFISYAHADDESAAQQAPWIQALVDSIRERHQAEFSPRPLDVFFDKQAIKTMDDWDLRIKKALKGSRVMLAILSPAYFASEYCKLEWQLYLDRELDRGLPGRAIAPLYVIEVPGFEKPEGEELERWMSNMGSRQYIDIRPWWAQGPEALRLAEVQKRMLKLDEDIADAVELSDRVADSPTNIPEHNPHFCGREVELKAIRESLATGRTDQVCVVQGLGGMGKSALVFEYAHAFGTEYPGGRYLVHATGQDDLRTVLLQLAEPLGIQSTGQSGGDDDIQIRRICEILRQGPPRLMIIDNVEDADVLARSAVSVLLPAGDMLDVIATTRLPGSAFVGANLIEIGVLEDDDCVSLFEKYRPADGDSDREAQQEIAALCGGYPLVVETAAVFVWQNPDVDYAGFAERIRNFGLETIDQVAAEERIRLSRHAEAMVSKVLEPTLANLSDVERIVMEYAAVMPPESIPWPWLRTLVARYEPGFADEPKPGFPDPWKRVQRRLTGLRLMTGSTSLPVARIHAVVQGVMRARCDDDVLTGRSADLAELALERATVLARDWYLNDAGWEIDAFFPLCLQGLESRQLDRVIHLATEMAQVWQWADKLTGAKNLYSRILREIGSDSPIDPVLVAQVEAALSGVLRDWLPAEAKVLARSAFERIEGASGADPAALAHIYQECALAGYESSSKKDKRYLLTRAAGCARDAGERGALRLVAILNNLGFSYVWQDDAEMRSRCEEALAIAQSSFLEDHPARAICMANIGWAEANLGNYDRAREMINEALAIDRKSLSPDHMHLNFHLSNLATIESASGNHEVALSAAKEALEIDRRRWAGPLDIAMSVVKLAECEQNAELHEAAIEHYLEVLAIRDGVEGFSQQGNPDIMTRLGFNYEQLGRIQDAVGWYMRSRELGARVEGLEAVNTLGANWYVNRLLGGWRAADDHDTANSSPEVFLSHGPDNTKDCSELIHLMRPGLNRFGITLAGSDPDQKPDGDLDDRVAFSRSLVNTRATVIFANPDYFTETRCRSELESLFLRAVAEWTSRQGNDPATVPSWLTPAFLFCDAYDIGPGLVNSNRRFATTLLHSSLLRKPTGSFGDFDSILTLPRWTLEAHGATSEQIAPVLTDMLIMELIGRDPSGTLPEPVEIWATIREYYEELPNISIESLAEQLFDMELQLDTDRRIEIDEFAMFYQEWVVLLRAIRGGFKTTWAFHRNEVLQPTSDTARLILEQNTTLTVARKRGEPTGTLVNTAINYRIVEDIQRGYYCYAMKYGRSIALETAVIAACYISLEMFDDPIGGADEIVRLIAEPLLAGTPIEDGF